MATRIGLALFATWLPLSAHAASLPPLAIPSGVGINIHFTTGHEKDLDLIAAAGIKVIRTDFKWDSIEQYQGLYDWSAYDELVANLAKRGIRPLFILDYSNGLYEESTPKLWQNTWPFNEIMSPRRPSSVAAFARWAAAAANRYRKNDVIWEIWNEPNITFWKPTPNVEEYARLAIATCDAIRATDVSATIIAPATSEFAWDFLESFFKTGALKCLDGISIHPYRGTAPESVATDYARLRKLIDQYTPASHKEKIFILNSEWGYPTVRKGIPLQDQANFAVRMQLADLLNGVPLSMWYGWKNDGPDLHKNAHNFGIVYDDLTPKPAYTALKVFTTQLAGYQLVRRLEVGSPTDFVLLFANPQGQTKLVAWTVGLPHKARIPAPPQSPPKEMTLIDGSGVRSTIRLEATWIPVRLTNAPVYIAP